MKRQLILATGVALLLAGWFSAFLLNTMPQYRTSYIIVPTLLLGSGMGVSLRVASGRLTALTVALTALTALLSINQIFPSRGVSISAFGGRPELTGADAAEVELLVRADQKTGPFAKPRTLVASAAVEARLFARLPGRPAKIAFDAGGRLYVSFPELGAVYRLTDVDGDGFADQSKLYHVGLDRPTGLAWLGERFFVAEPGQVLELHDKDRDGAVDATSVVVAGLPDDGGFWQRSLLARSDGLFLAIGARCNACEEKDPLRATVQKIDLDDTTMATYARGLRQVVDLTLCADRSLWAVEDGREADAGSVFPDEINRLVADGDFGWPYCYGDRRPDPLFGEDGRCQDSRPSLFDLPSAAGPSAIASGHDLNAPEPFRNSLYLVLGGDRPKLVRIARTGEEIEPVARDFLGGWDGPDGRWGRPQTVRVGPDGNIYLTDVLTHSIYQVKLLSEDH